MADALHGPGAGEGVMWRIPLGGEDRTLLLAPSWHGWGPAAQGIALVLSFLLPLVLIVMLYRWELRLVSRRAGIALLMFRLLGLTLIWSLAALQPTVAHVHVEETPSRVLVAVDLSGSMAMADPQRSWTEKLQLAQALRLHESHGIDAGKLAAFVAAAEHDKSPAAEFSNLGQSIDALKRRDIAQRLLTKGPANLLQRLGERHHVEVVGFHQALVDVAEPAALFEAETGTATNLSLPLQRALEQRSGSAGKLLGVLLLTDGQHNEGAVPAVPAKLLREQDVPIYPIALGSRTPPTDIAVTAVQAPAQVFKDAEATVTARLRVHGLPAQNLKVTLDGPSGFTQQQKTIQHDGKDGVHTVEFPVKLDVVGAQRLEVEVHATSKGAIETTTDNNRLATVVRVASEKSRILLVDDEARWEHHFLATALLRDADLKVDRVLFSQPRIGAIAEDELEGLGHASARLPAVKESKEDPLLEFDAIVLGDVPTERLPAEEAERLEKYVAERGGTLIVVAGKRHMPLQYLSSPHRLAKVLPLETATSLTPREGFAVLPTELGEKTPFFQLEGTVEASRQRWTELPVHYWGVTGKLKAGAVTLARARRRGSANAATEEDTGGVIVQQHYGFGKVVFLGLESTWRWRYRTGDHYHHRFWGQLLRWAVSDPFLPDGNRYVRFGSKAPVYRHDQEIELLARLGEETVIPKKAALKVIRQRDGKPDETAAIVELAAQPQRPRLLEGKIKQLPPGNYRLELDIPELRDKLADLDKDAAQVHGFTVTPPENGEHVDLATNRELLQSLAQTSGGRLFTAADAQRLPDLLESQVQRKETRSEDRPWQDLPLAGWILAVLIVLLTLEWSLRKVAGLP
jgi:hypothetical protein